eukprot:UN12384
MMCDINFYMFMNIQKFFFYQPLQCFLKRYKGLLIEFFSFYLPR